MAGYLIAYYNTRSPKWRRRAMKWVYCSYIAKLWCYSYLSLQYTSSLPPATIVFVTLKISGPNLPSSFLSGSGLMRKSSPSVCGGVLFALLLMGLQRSISLRWKLSRQLYARLVDTPVILHRGCAGRWWRLLGFGLESRFSQSQHPVNVAVTIRSSRGSQPVELLSLISFPFPRSQWFHCSHCWGEQ